jgi:Tol biopolymer transport system component
MAAVLFLTACNGEAPVEPGATEYRLLFVGGAASGNLQQISTMDLNGSQVEPVLSEYGGYEELRSSPDGRKVLLLKTVGAEPLGTHVLDVEDAVLQVLPEVGPGYTWSPEGTSIASRVLVTEGRNPDGTQRPPSHRVRITDQAGTVLATFPHENAVYSWMSWSVDGNQLVYSRTILYAAGSPEVLRANDDGTGITNISNSPDYEGEAAWSPTEPLIALTAVRNEQAGVFTMRPDGTDLTLRHAGIASTLRWSPDGSRLLFNETTIEGSQLVVLTLASGSVAIAATGMIQGNSPFWSPDGRLIAYGALLEGEEELDVFVVEPDGSNRRNLTAGARHGRSPVWVRAAEVP